MTDPGYDLEPPGGSARDRLPGLEGEHIDRISLTRRESRTIAPPRKWRKMGLSQRVCPECRAVVPSVQDGFWHLQKVHNQGHGVDLDAWGQDLRDELDEFIGAAHGRRGFTDERDSSFSRLAPTLVGLAVCVAVIAIIMIIYVVRGM